VKKFCIVIVALSFLLPLQSQDIKVSRIKKIPVEQDAFFPEFGNSKNEIIYTGQNHRGLYQYRMRNERSEVIVSDNTPVKSFSGGEKGSVIFSVQEGIGKEKRVVYQKYDPENEIIEKIEGFEAAGDIIRVDGQKILLETASGGTKELAPTGDNFYVWASLSPDNKKILFTAVGKGTFVSDLDGNVIADAGTLNAPVWINNDWVLGMDDRADGHVTTSSDVYAFHPETGKKVEITSKTDQIALYPKASPDARRIVFHNLKGEVFTVNIRIRN
jgi:hypothetical protein